MTGIQRIAASFEHSKAFVAYLTAGDGGLKKTLDAALALIDAGVTILEIGVPFSDPVADGPVIQRAAARSLAAGTTLPAILDLVAEIRSRSDIPLILFTYLNPIFKILQTDFFEKAQQAGIDGLLVVDCPPKELFSLFPSPQTKGEGVMEDRTPMLQHGIAPIFVAAPTTSVQRIQQLDPLGKGFLYYACRKGTTGVRTQLPEDFTTKMQALKAHARLPVVVGFGIASRKAASQVLEYADGVVVGSLFVEALEKGMSFSDLQRLAMQINPLVGE